jgi:DUF1680 family protein
VTITLGAAPPREIAVKLRIPAWAAKASVAINGKPVLRDLAPAGMPS